MSTFIKVSEEQYYNQLENGYYESMSYNLHLYKWVSEKFNLLVKFPYLQQSSTVYFMILSSNFYEDYVACVIDSENNSWSPLFYHNSNNILNLDSIKTVVTQYNHILSEFPSLDDIISFLDLCSEFENILNEFKKVSVIKNLLIGEHEHRFGDSDWKSGLELLIDYTCQIDKSEPLILPMVII